MAQLSRLLSGAALAVAVAGWVPSLAGADAGFAELGDLPGGGVTSQAFGISADGLVVVGGSESTSGPEAFRWTAVGGMEGLGDSPGGGFSRARAASSDGSVIVGANNAGSGTDAFRWTAAGGMLALVSPPDLSGLPLDALDVSDDGNVVVGPLFALSGCLVDGYVWTPATGIGETCDDSPGGHLVLEAISYQAVSGDGNTVVGIQCDAYEGGCGAHRNWVFLPSSDSAYGTNADGSLVVGGGRAAFRWELGSPSVEFLGDLPGGATRSLAWDVSDDGATVVGVGSVGPDCFLNPHSPDYDGCEAFLWDAAGGIRRLQDELEQVHGLDLTGWTLVEARAISDDGNVVAGWGTNPSGDTEGFVAVFETECSDGIDNDNDGLVDLEDPGCDDEFDVSEKSSSFPCDDSLDNDGDGGIDFPGDIGCLHPGGPTESPECQDGIDNDLMAGIDFDGGESIWGIAIDEPDPDCVGRPWRNRERKCGLGPELILVVPLLWLSRRRKV